MATGMSIDFVWVESNNEWQIPEDWDPNSFNQSVSENLNEVAENWSDDNNLSTVCEELISPPEFLANPFFDTSFLDDLIKLDSRFTSTNALVSISSDWIQLGASLRTLEINPSAIAVPHGMTPWSWYALTEEEKLGQMGLSQSETSRADGVLYSAFNSFYFDTYRFGFFSFDLAEDKEINEILNDSEFISYCQEVKRTGPDSSFHEVCDEECAFRRCSKILNFPASISLW
jgi:hypothetical protein